jgi:tetratricopeptide (TPR) repeat protein
MRSSLALVLLCGLAGGCMSPAKVPVTILPMPGDTSTKAAAAMAEGERLFRASDWAGAAQAYQAAAVQQPALAEAHYNWAVSLDRMGNKAEAKKHYLEAANLAPGNKVIWDSPPLRETGLNHNLRQKSYLDPTPGQRF